MFEPTVRLVNRVRDGAGQPVPWEAYFDGQAFKITDSLDVPFGVARVLIHHSMYAFDLDAGVGKYRLGCAAPGLEMPTDPIDESEVLRSELIDREALLVGRRVELKRHANPIRRHDPLTQASPGRGDGAYAAGYGDAYANAR